MEHISWLAFFIILGLGMAIGYLIALVNIGDEK